MNPNKTLALICCYLGKLPWYLDYFLHSCKYNPSVDFFLITDDRRQFFDLTTNVKTICMEPELYLAQIPNNFMISPTRIYRRGTSSLPAT